MDSRVGAMRQFEDLSTSRFQATMRPHAVAIYQRLFPDCQVQDLREEGVKVHVLDKEFGIDTLATFSSGQWISIQEKYRSHKFLVEPRLQVQAPIPDFTQEFKNGHGTEHESPGEWFHLGAQLYFYGWADADNSRFEKWALIDIAKYKLIVERRGGIKSMGQMKHNRQHGRASFVAFPITAIRGAFVATHKIFEEKMTQRM